MSVPSFFISPFPKGIIKSGSIGTSPFILYCALYSRKITGLLSLIADFKSPFTSAGVPGATTLSPGILQNHDSSDWECCAADPTPEPAAHLNVTGTCPFPPNMYLVFAA